MVDPRLPTCSSFFFGLGRFIYEGLPCLNTPAAVPARVATIDIFPPCFSIISVPFWVLFRSFSVWGVPRQPLGAPPGRRRGPKVTLGGVFVIPLPRSGVFWQPLGRPFHRFFGFVFRRALFECPGRRFDTQSARKGSPVIPPEVSLLW